MLRETIMCCSDVTLITFYDKEAVLERKLPIPDFPSLHTCRNFEDILWLDQNNHRTLEWDEVGLDLSRGRM